MGFRLLILATMLHYPLATNAFAAEELPLVNPEGCNYFLLIAADEPELSAIGLDKIEESDIDLPYRMEIKKTEGAPADEIDSYPGLRAAMDAIKKYNGQRLRFVNFGEPSGKASMHDPISEGLLTKESDTLNRVFQNQQFNIKKTVGEYPFDESGNKVQRDFDLEGAEAGIVYITLPYSTNPMAPILLSIKVHPKTLDSPILVGTVQDGKIKELFFSKYGNGHYELPRILIPKSGEWSLVVYGF